MKNRDYGCDGDHSMAVIGFLISGLSAGFVGVVIGAFLMWAWMLSR